MTEGVSVVLPTYNDARYLAQALDGVFRQTYQDYHLIVVDDGSTDGTPDVLAHYQRLRPFTLISQAHSGLPSALNAGFARARGEFLTWTSSDNVMRDDMLAALVAALRDDASVGLVYADFNIIDHHGRELGSFETVDYDRLLLLHQNLVRCCFLYRAACAATVGGYDPALEYSEDWDYWIRLSQHCSMKRIGRVLYQYRVHKDSMTSGLVVGTAKSVGYGAFSRHVRELMPARWCLGKMKWWMLRLRGDHPAIRQAQQWRRIVSNAAVGHECE